MLWQSRRTKVSGRDDRRRGEKQTKLVKILHVIPGLSVRGGGSNRACAELCESLARLGHDVTILYLTDDHDSVFSPRDVELVGCKPDRLFSGKKAGVSCALRQELEKRLPDTDILHIHALWRYTTVAACKVAKKMNKPFVVQPHGSLNPWKLRHKPFRKWFWGYIFQTKVLRNAHMLVAESETDRDDIRVYLRDKTAACCIVPCGAYPQELNRPTPYSDFAEIWPSCSGKNIILCLTRIDVNKGIDLLIHSVKELRNVLDNYHLLIIGPDYGGTVGRLKELAIKIGVQDQTTWGGMVQEDLKRFVFHEAAFYVLPSRSENFGISVLEALFCRCPVITTTATPWLQLEDKNAGIVVEPTVRSLSAGIERMLGMTGMDRRKMTENGYRIALESYQWDPVARRMAREYEAILRDRKS